MRTPNHPFNDLPGIKSPKLPEFKCAGKNEVAKPPEYDAWRRVLGAWWKLRMAVRDARRGYSVADIVAVGIRLTHADRGEHIELSQEQFRALIATPALSELMRDREIVADVRRPAKYQTPKP
jgi:hypothetical protein